jgi:L-threonylcarbamoyladenylate synthase
MITQVEKLNPNLISKVISLLEENQVVVWPSDHTYGLISHGLRKEAVEKIYSLKGRDINKPLGYLTNKNKAFEVGRFDETSKKLTDLWPCPISLIVSKKEIVPSYITTSYPSLLLVCPDFFSCELAEQSSFPIACTSANLSGEPAVVNLEQAYQLFNGKVPLIVDNGQSKYGENGTIVDCSVSPPKILRFGPFPIEKLQHLIPNIVLASNLQ